VRVIVVLAFREVRRAAVGGAFAQGCALRGGVPGLGECRARRCGHGHGGGHPVGVHRHELTSGARPRLHAGGYGQVALRYPCRRGRFEGVAVSGDRRADSTFEQPAGCRRDGDEPY